MKMKVKDFLLSPWLPVWTAILMMANVVAVDVLHLAWPITVVWSNVQCPVECAIAISVAAVAVAMLVVELRKRRWLRVGMRLLLVLAGFGILMAGSGLWLAYCHDLNHTMMIEVESVNGNLLDVDGWKAALSTFALIRNAQWDNSVRRFVSSTTGATKPSGCCSANEIASCLYFVS